MSQETKKSRKEIYDAVWQMPMVKVASEWGTSTGEIVKACERMNVPRPAPGHWASLKRGWEVEQPPLLPPEKGTPAAMVLKAPVRPGPRKPAEESVEEHKEPRIAVPNDLSHAHRLVKQTLTALRAGEVDPRNGFLEAPHRWDSQIDQPLSVTVSAEQVERALRILDAVIKAVAERGGRFERGPESSRLRLLVGKQPVWFWIREAMKRSDKFFTAEQREAKDSWLEYKYEWRGSGFLRFYVGGEESLREVMWQESSRWKLEDHLDEIVEKLANVEQEAERIRKAREEEKREREEQRRRHESEWAREREEEENRERLEAQAEAWAKARRVRGFILACERQLRLGKKEFPADGWEARWLAWAREHAGRLDPLQGYLEEERERLDGGVEEEDDESESGNGD